MQVIFSFTLNTKSKQVVYAGNVTPLTALKILQDVVISGLQEGNRGDGDQTDKAKEVKDAINRRTQQT